MKLRKLSIALSAWLLVGIAGYPAGAAPVTMHPRLWITQADIPRLQSWATASNPMYANGLLPALNSAIDTYNTKFFPGGQPNPNWAQVDNGGTTFSGYPAEAYAEFFAFMSLIDPDPGARIQHARRARNLLMYVINEAAKGHAQGLPYRDPNFATYDRSRWWGEGFGLTVDWIYSAVDQNGNPILTAADKTTLRQVFLMWADDNLHGYMAPPIGVTNDPQLLNGGARESANNYYSGHMRNLTLMSLALDQADDPPLDPGKPAKQLGNTLRSYLDNVTGEWLYQQYALFEKPEIVQQAYGLPASYLPKLGNASGGLPAEGFLYGESLAYVRETLLALRTAGYEDPALAGPQSSLGQSAYWDRYLQGFLSSLAPAPTTLYSWQGPVYQPAAYGDTLRLYIEPTAMEAFGALGVYDQITGNGQRLQQERWIAANVIEGGLGKLFSRASNIWGNAYATQGILYFLLFDPVSAQAPAQIPDPRPSLPTRFYDPALGRLLSRTDWTPNATFFDFKCSWISINHQNGDGNQFELYRKGEWLTKEHTNYDNAFIGQTTDYHNTLSLQNDVPGNLLWYETQISQRGSQWMEGMAAGDPAVIASTGSGYEFVQGDATHLYNRPYQWGKSAMDIVHASRSIVWLKPDYIVAYDRAGSKTTGRFKRFNLQFVTPPAVIGKMAVQTLPSGQQLFIQNLLPANATLTVSADEPINPVADGEPTRYRLVVEDPDHPTDVRFLHVLQGADGGVQADPAALIRSNSGTPFEGAVVRNIVILFPVDLSTGFTGMTYIAPAAASVHLITGLVPGADYDVLTQTRGSGLTVQITPNGTGYQADSGGVLVVLTGPAAISISPAGSTFPANGGTGSVAVTAFGNAAWGAISNSPWIIVTSGATGNGNGNVNYSVTPNSGTVSRSGSITIGDQTFTVTQTPQSCSFALASYSASFSAAGGTGLLGVTTAGGCPWSAVSNSSWITITSVGTGNGNGSVVYSVAPNASANTRTGSVTIAGQTFSVNQTGTAPPDTAAPAVRVTAPANGTSVTGTISITASATDNIGVAAVQFLIDGNNLGNPVVSYPYTITLDTSKIAAGPHSLSATARDRAGNIGKSTPVNIVVLPPGTVVTSFQNGANGYAGTRDVTINNQYAQWNGGNGLTDTTGMVRVEIVTGSSGWESRGLLRFGSITLPAGAIVTSASLSLTFQNWVTGFSLNGYYLNTPWNPGSTSTVSWSRRDVSALWAVPGAGGDGKDRIAGESFVISDFNPNGDQVLNIALNASVVQRWTNNPASNQGVLLVMPVAGKGTKMYSSETSTVKLRPKLTITYVLP